MNREQISAEIIEYQVREAVKAKQAKAGLPAPIQPENSNDLYREWENLKKSHGGIANIPFNQLGDFLDQWTGLVSYARWCEGLADIDVSTAREIRDTVKKQLYMLQDGGREIREAAVHIEQLYRECEQTFTQALAMYTATRSLREGYETRANAISREITRRGNDMNDTRRSVNRGFTA